jgi:hypothetical protein
MDLSDMACLSPSGTLRRHGLRLPKQTIELILIPAATGQKRTSRVSQGTDTENMLKSCYHPK